MEYDASWYRPRLRPRRVRWDSHGTQLPALEMGTAAPTFLSMCIVAKRQDGSRIKMPLGKEVGLGPGDIVLDEDPVPPKRGHSSPHFSADVYCGQTVSYR